MGGWGHVGARALLAARRARRAGVAHVVGALLRACCARPYSLHHCSLASQDDVREAPVELYHRLKLYDDTGAANPKKPVVQARCVLACVLAVVAGAAGARFLPSCRAGAGDLAASFS